MSSWCLGSALQFTQRQDQVRLGPQMGLGGQARPRPGETLTRVAVCRTGCHPDGVPGVPLAMRCTGLLGGVEVTTWENRAAGLMRWGRREPPMQPGSSGHSGEEGEPAAGVEAKWHSERGPTGPGAQGRPGP